MERSVAEPIILCPLAFEREALARSGIFRGSGRLTCIGPGEHGIERLRDMIADAPAGPVFLAGVAGTVDGSCPAGSACVISEVISEDGMRWKPPWRGSDQHPAATIACSRDVLTTAQMKRDFAQRTGAQLVDQESEPFARLATERGWTWGIVRGISDDLSTSLPPDIHKWITNGGRTRIHRAMISCVLRPRQIGSLFTLHRNSARAMAAVGEILRSEI